MKKKDGIVARGLKKVRNLLREHSATGGLSERQAAQLLVQRTLATPLMQ